MGSYYIGAMCWYAKNDIQHYQVKGAKHGVRRWQYKDGSLTPEGRIHYGIGPAREKKAADDPKRKQFIMDTVQKLYDERDTKGGKIRNYGYAGISGSGAISAKAFGAAVDYLGKNASETEKYKLAAEIMREQNRQAYKRETGEDYSVLTNDTDFSNLEKKDKERRELEVLNELKDRKYHFSDDADSAGDHLMMRIWYESGNPYTNIPVSFDNMRVTRKADLLDKGLFNKLFDRWAEQRRDIDGKYDEQLAEIKTEAQYEKLADKYFFDQTELNRKQDKEYKQYIDSLKNNADYQEYMKLITETFPSVVLKDIGYEDTPKARELIMPLVSGDYTVMYMK